MKYYGTNFLRENLHLRNTPRNATEAYNKLVCFIQLEQQFDDNANKFYVKPLSKRRKRILRIFDAYKMAGIW